MNNWFIISAQCIYKYYSLCFRLISFVEFRSFESLLWQPDAVNQMAFQLFDQEHQGRVSFGEIQREVGWVKGREGRREREGGREK